MLLVAKRAEIDRRLDAQTLWRSGSGTSSSATDSSSHWRRH
jgi:hypothetical protein